jgi:hypothetical protein
MTMKRFLLIALLVGVVFAAVGTVTSQSTSFWTAEYFNNTTRTPPASVVQTVGAVNFNWGLGSPAPGIPVDFFSARFTTTSFFRAGLHTFSVLADDGFTLRVNNVPVMTTEAAPQPGKVISVQVNMVQGTSVITVDYFELTGQAFITVNWVQVSGSPAPPVVLPTAVPPGTLVPSATSVTTQFGNFTPCIQQNIHQSNCFTSTGAWDAPDLGSIQMEPQIVIWGNCTPDAVVTQQVYVGQPAQLTSCSKTGAGWYIVE